MSTSVDESQSRKTPGVSKFFVLRIAVALLLLVAAAAKLIRFVEVESGDGLLSNPWLLCIAIGLESAVAIFVLFAPGTWSRRVILFVFACFIGVSTYAVSTGASCNCIVASIPAKGMLCIDVFVFLFAVLLHPSEDAETSSLLQPILLSLIAGALMTAFATQRQATQRSPIDGEPIEYLLADVLVGQRWPLDSRHHPKLAELESGTWLVLIVRRDCEHCKELLDDVFSDPARHPVGTRTAVFVAGENEWPFQFDKVTAGVGTNNVVLWPTGEPFVASPAVFSLSDGKVAAGNDGQQADTFLKQAFETRRQ